MKDLKKNENEDHNHDNIISRYINSKNKKFQKESNQSLGLLIFVDLYLIKPMFVVNNCTTSIIYFGQ